MKTVVDIAKEKLNKALETYNHDADRDLINRALEFSLHAHRDQMRRSGEPYIIHPIHVAAYLTSFYMDSQAIAAGLLHDVLEDTEATPEELTKEFGPVVTQLVEGVSKLRKIKFQENTQYVENLRKFFIATAEDIRVIMIRLCDRLHNMETLEYLPAKEQQRIARETLEIYAPIAHRLQIGKLRGQLEDWSFKYLQPEEYRWLYNVTRKNVDEREATLREASDRIKLLFKEEEIELVDIQRRIKFIYSLYRKLQRYGNELSQIFDVVALRVIVPEISDCYAALGLIHKEFKPLKGRIKDYIARPKANGYRSLHTTVHLQDGDTIEIQIRTPGMHEEATYGIAAHWQYKENGKFPKRQMQISWVKELANIMREIHDTSDLENVKLDLFKHRIFVLTPKNDVIDLPDGSTPVDFAYNIHTDLGNKLIRAKVNGNIAPLSHKLQNGDIVEVIIDKKKKGPDIQWLDFAQTALARSKIKYYNRKKLADWEKNLGDKNYFK